MFSVAQREESRHKCAYLILFPGLKASTAKHKARTLKCDMRRTPVPLYVGALRVLDRPERGVEVVDEE